MLTYHAIAHFPSCKVLDCSRAAPVIFKVSLKMIPLVVISPTVLELSATAIELPDRRKTVDKAATFFIIVLYGERLRPSMVGFIRSPIIRKRIDEDEGVNLIFCTVNFYSDRC